VSVSHRLWGARRGFPVTEFPTVTAPSLVRSCGTGASTGEIYYRHPPRQRRDEVSEPQTSVPRMALDSDDP